MPRLRRRKPKLDTAKWPCVYVGPPTHWGLATNSPCRITAPYRGGLVFVQTVDGQSWRVLKAHLISSAINAKAGRK